MASSQKRSFGTFLRGFDSSINKQAETVKQPVSVNFTIPSQFKDEFDGRKVWARFLSPIRDQGSCSSCYAYAVVGTLADKYALQTLLQVKPEFNPLEIVMCKIDTDSASEYTNLRDHLDLLQREENVHLGKACRGDTIYDMGEYLYRYGALETSCAPMAPLVDALKTNGRLPVCTVLEGEAQETCFDEKTAQRAWPIWSFYTLEGKDGELETALMSELLKWGPVTVAFNVFKDFAETYDGKSIYTPIAGQTSIGGHAVKLVGWGNNPSPYWICANSWGSDWGENGYFKIARMNSMLALETNHMGVWPQLPGQDPTLLQFPVRVALMSHENILEREYNAIDPINFYPAKLIPLIKEGKLKGDLNPRFDASKIPDRSSFLAYAVNDQSFTAADGSMVRLSGNVVKGSVWWLIPLFGVIILLGLWIWKRQRN